MGPARMRPATGGLWAWQFMQKAVFVVQPADQLTMGSSAAVCLAHLAGKNIAMWWKAVLLWFMLMVLAIANGTVRIKLIIPHTGLTMGLAISTLMLCALILFATWLSIRWMGPDDAQQALGIGALWLALTLAFEFGAGHFLFKKPWSELLLDYDLSRGRIWVLVPIVTTLAPWLMAKARGLID